MGDQVLADVADVLRGSVRDTDIVCRVGGEEFAVIVPSGDLLSSVPFAKRLASELSTAEFGPAGRLTVSIGVALGPDHAANPRELVACAEAAMMTAKAQGKNRAVVFDERGSERPFGQLRDRGDVRSIAHLKLLQSLSAKLSRLNDTAWIGQTVADELRLLIDYHNCRVFLREGDDLVPIAFRGDLTVVSETAEELLTTTVGRGVTGRVAETGEPLLIADAARCEFGEPIPGTPEIEESLLAVPLTFGSRVIGVIVVSKLGLDQFDDDDLRLLQVLAGHASVALENARLYEVQRREAESATALLEFGRELALAEGLQEVAERVADGAATILGSPTASLWLQDATGDLVLLAARGGTLSESAPKRIPAEHIEPWESRTEPYFVGPAQYASIAPPPEDTTGHFAVAPFTFDGRWGVIAAAIPPSGGVGERELALLGGMARQARLALQNAESFETLETTFISTVEALANALEANDEYTSRHARWITDLALKMGSELGLDARARKRLELGALFHDIGKIGIPASILAKPGPLTPEEQTIVETHPLLGERILSPIEQLAEVRRIVRACHERWDGTGYPDGLAGEDIPLEARIILVCDAYHAMTTDRPYRVALPVEEAKRRLSTGAATQFDPAVVEACLRVLADA
jgi:HD-GYP domain-containing protein (c-di-GMP phosphodiesterase class II)/putative methionine-R-sulfoxide reductase with GAF domain